MDVKKYRKKPEDVLAVRYTPETVDDCVKFLENGNAKYSITFDEQGKAELKILNGRTTNLVVYGDYIVRDEYGEYFLYKSYDFGLTYEPIEESGDMFIEIKSAITIFDYAVNIDDIESIERGFVDISGGKEVTIIKTKFSNGGWKAKETPEEILKKIANAGVVKVKE